MKRLKIFLTQKKYELIVYFSILVFCIIVCSPLLQMHIASETYNLMDLGYFNYPSIYFLSDARLISTLVTYLAGFLHLSYPVFIVGMEVLAIFITSVSIFLLYKTLLEKLHPTYQATDKLHLYDFNLKNILLMMGSTILILNAMSLEYLLYAECAVMCLSVLLCVFASRIFTSQTNFKYSKALLFVILATFCYQGSTNIFVVLTLLFLFLDKNDHSTKELIKQSILSLVFWGISLFINVIAIYIIQLLLQTNQSRIFNEFSSYSLSYFINLLAYIIDEVIMKTFNLWPYGILPIIIMISTILSTCSKDSTKSVLQYILLVLLALGVCILPIFFLQSPSIEPRMAMSIGAIVGISFIYLNTLPLNAFLQKCIIVATVGFFVFNSVSTLQIFTAHIATNKIDANIGLTIKYKIEQYEKASGKEVTKVAYYRDARHKDFPYGYEKKFSSFSQRALDNYYCIIEALNYFCDRKFEKVDMDVDIYLDNFAGKDWNTYSDEQLVFQEDTLYLCTY